MDEIREKRNLNAKSMKGKMEAEARAALVAEGKSLKEELAAVEGGLNALVGAVQAGYPAHPWLVKPFYLSSETVLSIK